MQSAEEAFRAWVKASRAPDVKEACAAMSDRLVKRMLADLRADGFPGVDDCAGLVTLTADLYKAFGSGDEVEITVRSETETDAVLFVTYSDTGKCGTVVMERSPQRWVINEQSEECA